VTTIDRPVSKIATDIFKTGVVRDENGNAFALKSHVDQAEGNLIFDLIHDDESISTTLEVGCAYGLASLYICSALARRKNARHVIVDPFQKTQWKSIGLLNLERSGFHFFELFELGSEFALPEIARQEKGSFDLIFIDGWHTFDHTLVDLFYANLLLRVGGYIVVDDCNWPAVAKAVNYLLQYPSYQLDREVVVAPTLHRSVKTAFTNMVPARLARKFVPHNLYERLYVRTLFPSMVVLKKASNDERKYNWYPDSF
jgi:predicted O-methyltransferase YrrM